MKAPETPFPKHWLAYIVLKLAILGSALALGLMFYGYW